MIDPLRLLACLFQRKRQAIVIARSLSSLWCKNLNVADYLKSIIGINTKLAHHDKMHLQDKGHNSENYSFGVMSLFNLNF